MSNLINIDRKKIKFFLLFGVFYLLIVKGSLLFVIQPEKIVLIWPPSGIALAMLLLNEKKYWKTILSSILFLNTLANLWSGNTILLSLSFAFANTLEPLLGGLIMTSLTKVKVTFTRLKEVIYLLIVATLSNAVTATIGAAIPSIAFGANYWNEYLSWWVPEGLGILLFTPFIITWVNSDSISKSDIKKHLAEGIFLALLLTGVACYIFIFQTAENLFVTGYVIFPILLWVALRFTNKGASAASLVLSAIVLWGTAHGMGMFASLQQTQREHILSAELFLSVVCFSSAVLAAIISERKQSMKTQVALYQRVSVHERTLVDLATKKIPLSLDLNQAAMTITQAASEATGASRVSIWLLNDDASQLKCVDLYNASEKKHSGIGALQTNNYPHYFEALQLKRVIDASDAINHPDTYEFKDDYLIPLGISSMLDATVRKSGKTVGVVCFEQVSDSIRTWNSDEFVFAREIADQVTHLLLNIERNQTENALKISEENYRNIINFAPVGFFQSTLEGTINLTNDRYAKILGYECASDIINFNFEKDIYYNPSERTKIVDSIIQNTEIRELELRIRKKDGSSIWTSNDLRLIKDSNGKPKYFEGFVRDVEEQRKVKEELIKLSRAVEQSPSSVVITDLNGSIEYVNNKFIELSGYSLQEVIGKNPRILQSGETPKEVYKEMWETINSGKTWQGEFHNKKKNGELFWENALISPVLDANGSFKYFLAVKEDISEKKQMIEELKSVQERFELAVQGSTDGLWDWIIPSNKVYYSPQWKRMIGFEDEEIPNHISTLINRVHPAEKEQAWAHLKEYLKNGTNFDTEFRLQKKDNSFGWFRIRGKAVRDDMGKAIRLSGSMTDITLRKDAESKLLQSEERFRELIENASDIIFVINDTADEVLYSSKAVEKVLGYKVEEIVGTSGRVVIHPDDLHRVIEAHIFTLQNPGESLFIQYRIKHKDGSWRTFEAIGKNLLHNPSVGGVVVNLRDITERKIAEEKLKNNEALFHIITSGVSDLIVILDLEGKRIYASDSYKTIFGDETQIQGTDSFSEIHPDDKDFIRELFYKTLEEKVGKRAEYRFKLNNGDIRNIQSQGNIIFDEKGDPFRIVVVSRDITDYKRTESELRASQQLLFSINQNISEAIYRITPQNKLLYINDAFAKMFGYDSIEEALETSSPLLLADVNNQDILFSELSKKDSFHNLELKFERKNGTVFWGLLSANANFNEKGQILYYDGAISDITYLKETEAKILELNKDLEKKIEERTIELKTANENLIMQINSREKVERIQNAIYQISETIHKCSDMQELYNEVHRIIGELFTARNFYIALYDSNSNMVSFPYQVDQFNKAPGSRKFKKGLTEYVLKTKKSLLVNSKIFNELKELGEVESIGTEAAVWLGVPLIINKKLIGLMAVQEYSDEDIYGEEEREMFDYIAQQVAIAIERKQNEIAEKRRVKLILENRNIFIELANIDEGNFNDALEIILNATSYAINIERVGFWRLNKSQKHFYCEKIFNRTLNSSDISMEKFILPLVKDSEDEKFTDYLEQLNYNKPIVEYNIQTDYKSEISELYLKTFNLSAIMIVPVWFQNEVVGVLTVENAGENREFIIEEEDFMSSIATLVSLAMESSNRRIAEENLKKSEQQYKLVIDNANEAIIVAQDGMLKFVNPRTSEITGYKNEELLMTNFLDFIHEEDRHLVMENYIRRMKGEAISNNYSFRVICKDKSYRVVEINAVQIMWQGKPATLNFLGDITERKKAEEEIKKSLAKEKELSELRSRFISIASHEFRTPLTTINSSAEIIEKYSGRLSEEQKNKNLTRIQENVKHMTQLLNDVLFIGKTESGKLQLRREELSIYELCINLIEQFEMSTIQRTGHKIIFTHKELPEKSFLDPKLMRHILENLISNAIKYSPNKSEVFLEAKCSDGIICFTIQDFGIGIPQNDLNRLFEPFHRAENVGTVSGTGLGLAIVKNSVELHGGSIEVESIENAGTTFSVQIPLVNK